MRGLKAAWSGVSAHGRRQLQEMAAAENSGRSVLTQEQQAHLTGQTRRKVNKVVSLIQLYHVYVAYRFPYNA